VLSNSPTLVTPNLGTPSAVVLTNASGTASININGTVGGTTPAAGSFTTLSANVSASLFTTTISTNDQSTNRLKFINSGSGGETWEIVGGNPGASNSGLSIFNGATTYGRFTTTGLNSTAIGATTASTGAFTTLTSSSNYTVAAGFKLTQNTNAFISPEDNVVGAVVSGTGAVHIKASGSSVGVFSSTGLAVTGALSSTTGATFATSSGSVGIGTASPVTGLHVKGAFPTGFATIERTGVNGGGPGSVVTFKNDGKTAGDGVILNIAGLDSADNEQAYAQIRSKIVSPTSTSEAGEMQFWTTTAGTITQKVTIDNSGNVGIGTASPAAKLDMVGTQKLQNSVVVNSSTQSILTSSSDGIAGLCWIRNSDVGGQALVLWDASFSLTIVSQLGSIFTTSSPSATQIQLSVGGSAPYYVQAIAGATRNGNTLRVSAINNH
jgi:hypothetical protein